MEDIKDTVIYWPSVRIIAHAAENDLKEVLVDPDDFVWGGEEHEEDLYLTLEQISEQLQKRGYGMTYYVWTESGLSGRIYQYGNYDPPTWVEHGTTKGYA